MKNCTTIHSSIFLAGYITPLLRNFHYLNHEVFIKNCSMTRSLMFLNGDDILVLENII